MANDELKALCESNAKAIQALTNTATEERQARSTNTDEIDTLLGAVSSNEVACRELRQTVETLVSAIDGGNQRFEVLRNEAIADRQKSDERFGAQLADQRRSDERFEAQLAEIRAIGEQNRSLFLELTDTNRRVEDLEQAS